MHNFKFYSSSQGTSPNRLLKKKISKYASAGAHMCWIIHMISGSYVEVSQKYLLHRIAGISSNCYVLKVTSIGKLILCSLQDFHIEIVYKTVMTI